MPDIFCPNVSRSVPLQDSHVPLSMSVQHKFIAYAGYLHHKGLDALVGDVNQAAEIVLRRYAFLSYACM